MVFMKQLTDKIKSTALELGFDLVGITDSKPIAKENVQILDEWISNHQYGKMGYMAKNFDKRINPALLLENAKSIICVGLNYKLNPECEGLLEKGNCRVCRYGLYEDYHGFIKDKLYLLACEIENHIERKLNFKVCVDSVPIAERAIAQRAGLGFIGRNHFIINPKKGLQILLGELITDLELVKDSTIQSQCNNCQQCINACPTGALNDDGSFDASKCLSYLTIESKDPIDPQYQKFLGKRLFGCDECIKACPFDANAPIADKKDFRPQEKLMKLTPEQILKLDKKDFDSLFSNTAVHRTGLEKIKSNAQLIMNSDNEKE